MHEFDEQEEVPPRQHALHVWLACAILLVAPSLLVWFVRTVALGMQCTPGRDVCHGISIGGGLRDTLNLAWMIGGNTTVTLLVALVAAVAALCMRRPLLAGLSLLLMPILALLLPAVAVTTAVYPGCTISQTGIGDCELWGAHMGMSFHQADGVWQPIYDVVPYSFALAMMVGALGFLFFRKKT